MASLKKRKGTYYIRFFKKINGKRKQKALSLGTKIKREAQKLLIEYEDKYQRGEIDPFNGWTPRKEAKKKRQKLRGKYIPLHKAADQFIEERSQANQTTKDNYRRHLNMLEDQLGRTMPVTEILEKDIREFCFRDDIAPATQASYLRHLKVFFRWMHEKGILKEDITADIKPPKVPQKIAQKTISRKELEEVFKAFDKFYKEQKEKGYVTKPHQMRLWFKPMINTMYYCGMRASEAVNLKWNEVNLEGNPDDSDDHGHILIINSDDNTTKSKLERVIPIREPLKPWLVEWHKKQGEPTDGYVFPSSTGLNRFHGMTAGSLSKSFKKFVKLAEKVPNSVTLHGLRHSCATDLLRKGVPIHIVQKIMGHSTVDVTQIYEHLGQQDIKNAIKGID
ncbi:tyrosine-type recombinase/integrase [Aliifodinibius sp. S!AR15-10]|uniref:tyrosine-type recombinase/integrase n=1 Tax=Aliifodinibius sp. S!AR15-10 TaxID=2950437 RepID=UPI00286713AB|nr:tyrosine-type recombinase/integrase [Aliifodinibius sp. S!AR15-10]MDR8392219.1 tyrosine-type recombinase/integrase [Aliifodinibius sp. S!AR15-10]